MSQSHLIAMFYGGNWHPSGSMHQCGSPECAGRRDRGDVILVHVALAGVQLCEDIVAPVAGDARRRRRVTWHVVGARVAVVPMEVVGGNVRVLVRLAALYAAEVSRAALSGRDFRATGSRARISHLRSGHCGIQGTPRAGKIMHFTCRMYVIRSQAAIHEIDALPDGMQCCHDHATRIC